MQFHERLKAARNACGYTQHEVAARLGITDRAYRHWEAGDREPSIGRLIALADLFMVDLNWLAGRSDEWMSS